MIPKYYLHLFNDLIILLLFYYVNLTGLKFHLTRFIHATIIISLKIALGP